MRHSVDASSRDGVRTRSQQPRDFMTRRNRSVASARNVSLGLTISILLAICPVAAGPSVPIPAGAQTVERPDILLIVTDDQRADTLSAMPTLVNRVGERGIRFRAGFVPHALCCPARASILTGNHSHRTGVWNNRSDGYGAFDESSTLATWLDDAGYRTGLFGKYMNHWADADPTHVPPGWDEWFAFVENCCSFYGFTASVDGTPTEFGGDVYSVTESARRASDFILSAPAQPTFVLWAPDAPHSPATPETRYRGAFSDLGSLRPPNYMEKDVSDKPAWVRSRPIWDRTKRAAIDALRRRMFETLLSVDDGIEMLLDALIASGRLSNTLIVFTSDNGFLLGEHRMLGKPFPWKAGHRVPFVVRYDPLVMSPTVSNALVLTIDIPPTIVALAGVPAPRMDGKSLVPILRQERKGVRSFSLIEHSFSGPAPPYCGTRSRHALYVRYPSGAEEFYDYRTDPWELRNVVARPELRERIGRFRRFARERCVPRPPGFSW
jgi:N-acetylglucosamine-6-sulfatase